MIEVTDGTLTRGLENPANAIPRIPPTSGRAAARRRARAEATVWIAHLRSPHRSAESEAALRDWLEASSCNRQQFEKVSENYAGVSPALAATRGKSRSSRTMTKTRAPRCK
jgi:ferric-dicitrate binding protein FerR (iron transport regulator)